EPHGWIAAQVLEQRITRYVRRLDAHGALVGTRHEAGWSHALRGPHRAARADGSELDHVAPSEKLLRRQGDRVTDPGADLGRHVADTGPLLNGDLSLVVRPPHRLLQDAVIYRRVPLDGTVRPRAERTKIQL